MKTHVIFFSRILLVVVCLALISFGVFEALTVIFAGIAGIPILASIENSDDGKQKRHEIWLKMESLINKRKSENREFTHEEKSEYESLRKDFDILTERILALERSENNALQSASRNLFGRQNVNVDLSEFVDQKTMEPVPVFRGDQRFADHFHNPGRLSVGRAIRGMISGDWSGAEAERALSTGSNSGMLVPIGVFSTIVDLVRQKSVAAQAGAAFVPMAEGQMNLIRVADVSGIEVKSENEQFGTGAIVFDPVKLDAKTIGTYVVLSRELAQDSANAGSAIESALAQAIADHLDRLIFVGTGSGQPKGLLFDEAIHDIAVADQTGYGHILRAWSLIKQHACENATIISNPDVLAQFSNLWHNGVHDSSGFLQMPAILQKLPWLVSSAVPFDLGESEDQTAIFVGDFSKLLIGIRQQTMVEVSVDAVDFFRRNQVGIKVTMRADFAPMLPKQFSKITSVTGRDDWWALGNDPKIGEPVPEL